ncbi:MAG: hypothetical protein ACRDZ4_12625 [Egibacteraceae bacterium]
MRNHRMDVRTVATALAGAVRVVAEWAGPQTATALLHDALTVLSDDELEAELRTAVMLPADVATALEQDRRELAATLTAERAAAERKED